MDGRDCSGHADLVAPEVGAVDDVAIVRARLDLKAQPSVWLGTPVTRGQGTYEVVQEPLGGAVREHLVRDDTPAGLAGLERRGGSERGGGEGKGSKRELHDGDWGVEQ